jgi:hypothetical protein
MLLSPPADPAAIGTMITCYTPLAEPLMPIAAVLEMMSQPGRRERANQDRHDCGYQSDRHEFPIIQAATDFFGAMLGERQVKVFHIPHHLVLLTPKQVGFTVA